MNESTASPRWWMVVTAWALVGMPLAWGVYHTLKTAVQLFR
jgi:hypothetical protein